MAVTVVAAQSERVASRWLQLWICIIAMMAISNLQYAWTLFTIPLTENLKVPLSAVQLAFTILSLAASWLVPFGGYLVDRLGARLVVSVSGALVGLGWIGLGLADSLGALYTWSALGGLGVGAVNVACVGTALKWFPDRRGLAVGVVAGAFGFGTTLTILPINRMIASSGYQSTFITWGIIQGIVLIVAAYFMLTPPPGWKPVTATIQTKLRLSAVSYTPLQVVKTGRFWLLYVMMTLVTFGGLMVIAQFKPIAVSYGLDKTVVLWGITALGLALTIDPIVNGLTRPFWGWVSDHIGRADTMALAFTVEALAIFGLLLTVDRPIWFVVFAALTFFGWGEVFSLFPATIGDVFGPDNATANYGILYTSRGTAAIFAGWGVAKLVEIGGSWITVFWVAVACNLLAASLALFWLKPVIVRTTAQQ